MAYSHIAGGVCFDCKGRGHLEQAPSKRKKKWACIYSGKTLFYIKAKTEAEALKKAVCHWEKHRDLPAFVAVSGVEDIAVRPFVQHEEQK